MNYSAVSQDTGPGKKLLRRAGLKAAAAVAAGSLLLASAGVVYADDIYNSLDATIDSVVEVMPLNVGGPSGATTLAVLELGNDGKSGCNFQRQNILKLSLASSNPGVATVSPSEATFTTCASTQALTVTPHTAGSATDTATILVNETG